MKLKVGNTTFVDLLDLRFQKEQYQKNHSHHSDNSRNHHRMNKFVDMKNAICKNIEIFLRCYTHKLNASSTKFSPKRFVQWTVKVFQRSEGQYYRRVNKVSHILLITLKIGRCNDQNRRLARPVTLRKPQTEQKLTLAGTS